ncbi:hypothetical protein HELRODRAFT_189030 [Helobdella robusta]|uniref:non-specific serine/threonine protein kinase n=1 Tax=Helobdella robusta TaxID=6412 RepID=T1FQK8_HELRO|nr:hypothetical protein HELRODRAFT_189030 [Helobdella robusta]ESN99204.1 hypothetical protein HELRODRAFT_189030 [Helobdella robusta]
MSINSMVSSDWSAFPSPSSAFSSHNSSQERLNSSLCSTSLTGTQLLNSNISCVSVDRDISNADEKFASCSGSFLSTFGGTSSWNENSELDKSVSNNAHARNSFQSMSFRPRAQSFTHSPVEADADLSALNEFYRKRFPKATEEMELRLVHYLRRHSLASQYPHIKSDGSASFVYHQLNELASDCLEKSRENQISSQYLAGMVNNMEQLLENARSKTSSSCDELAQMIQELLIIISRPARLLECLEFDPKDFYRKLEETEVEVKKISSSDVVSYVFNQLGLEKPSVEPVYHHHRLNLNSFLGCQGKDCDSSDTSSNNSSYEPANFNVDVECHTSLTPPFFERHFNENQNQNALLVSSSTPSRTPQESDFETVKLISNGAYGAVLLVRHKTSKRLFAMKKLLKSNLVLRNMVEQVFAERDILTFIDNPFVVSFYCSFETKKFLCMVLEYVEGGDCGALLKNISGPLPLDMARLYFAETVLALEYLHNFGIVHRDLKPDNLLITSIGHIKLTDFGLSKIGLMKMTTNLFEGPMRDSKKFLDNQVFGTPEYIAPEVILRQEYGKPVDWWSMGIILYQFLVGCVPFTGNSPEEVFSEIVTGEIDWPEEEEFKVCDDAVDIIESLLIKDPTQSASTNECINTQKILCLFGKERIEGDELQTLVQLGSSGSTEVKVHDFFKDVDWNKRTDRYQHQIDDSGGDEEDEDDESELFKSFSTCSPRYSRTENHFKILDMSETPYDIRMDLMKSSFGNEKKANEDENASKSDNEMDEKQLGADQGETSSAVVCVDSMTTSSLQQSNDDVDYESILRNNTSILSLPERPHSLSGSSASEPSEKKKIPELANLRVTGSLKRAREALLTKSSSSSSLSNFSNLASTPTKSKAPHRLVKQLSRESSGSSFDDSSSFIETSVKVVSVTRNREGFGFNIRALKVLNPANNKYSFQHIIMAVEKGSPAYSAGLCVGDMLTHVNNVSVSGMNHSQVIELILQQQSQQKTNNENISASTTSTLSRKSKKNVFELLEKDEDSDGAVHSRAINKSSSSQQREVETGIHKTADTETHSYISSLLEPHAAKLDDKSENKNILRKHSLTVHDNQNNMNPENKKLAQSFCNIYRACNEIAQVCSISINKPDAESNISSNTKLSNEPQKDSDKSNCNKETEKTGNNASKSIRRFMKHTFSHKRSIPGATKTKWYDKEESKAGSSDLLPVKEIYKIEKEKLYESEASSLSRNSECLTNVYEMLDENLDETASKLRGNNSPPTDEQSLLEKEVEEADKISFSPSSPPTFYQSVEFRVIPTVKVKRSLKMHRRLSTYGCRRKSTSEYLNSPRTLLIQQKRTCQLRRTSTQKWYMPSNSGFSSSDSGSASMSPTMQKHNEQSKCPLSAHHRCLVNLTSSFIPKQQPHSLSSSRNSRPSSLLLSKRRTSLGGPLLSPLVLCSSPISHGKNRQAGSSKESYNSVDSGAGKCGSSNVESQSVKSHLSKNETNENCLHLSEMINDMNIHSKDEKPCNNLKLKFPELATD